MSDIKDLREKLAAKRVELKELFESSEDGKYSTEQKNEIGKRNEELASLVEEVNLKSAQAKNEKAIDADSQPVASNFPTENETLTIGEQFVKSDAWKNYKESGIKGVDSRVKFAPNNLETKTTLTTTGYPPEVLRQPGILEKALRDPDSVIGLFDQITTDQNSFSYLEETTFTNNAAEAAEGSAVGEAALAFTENTESIRKLGVFLPVTDELLADEAGIQGYLNSRLQTMIKLRLDSQLLSGDGSAPNLEGILDAGKSNVGSTNYSTEFNGNLGRVGAIYSAITNIRVNAFTEPDAIIMHPNDWNTVVTSLTGFAGDSSAGYAANVPLFMGVGAMGNAPVSIHLGIKSCPNHSYR